MSASEVGLIDGTVWTNQYFEARFLSGSGIPVNISVDWYMTEGPNRYFHPGMFTAIRAIMFDSTVAPGTYDLSRLSRPLDLVASMSHSGSPDPRLDS
jgi:hypothetical protein